MRHIIVIIIIIIIITLLIYWLKADSIIRYQAKQQLLKSGGQDNQYSRSALTKLMNISNPTVDDHITRANIVRHNILMDNFSKINQPQIAYIAAEYNKAVTQLQDALPTEHDQPAAVTIQRIQEFEQLIDNQLQPEWTISEMELDDNMILEQILTDLHNNIAADKSISKSAHQVRQSAENQTDSAADIVNVAINNAQHYTNDAQNVHDSKVNSDLRTTLDILSQTYPSNLSAAECIQDAKMWTEKIARLGATKCQLVSKVLDIINKGHFIMTFNTTEDMIFAYVWARCSHPLNKNNTQLMYESVIMAVIDCLDNDTIVCINGRCARIIGSLATLDYDPRVGSALTFEVYRNQILQEVSTAIDKTIAECSQNNQLNSLVTHYTQTAEITGKLINIIKQSINNVVDQYKDKLSSSEQLNIKQECYVYAAID